jgi:hypothetical protein
MPPLEGHLTPAHYRPLRPPDAQPIQRTADTADPLFLSPTSVALRFDLEIGEIEEPRSCRQSRIDITGRRLSAQSDIGSIQCNFRGIVVISTTHRDGSPAAAFRRAHDVDAHLPMVIDSLRGLSRCAQIAARLGRVASMKGYHPIRVAQWYRGKGLPRFQSCDLKQTTP